MWRNLTEEERQIFSNHFSNQLNMSKSISLIFKVLFCFMIIIGSYFVITGFINSYYYYAIMGVIIVIYAVNFIKETTSSLEIIKQSLNDINNGSAQVFETEVLDKAIKKLGRKKAVYFGRRKSRIPQVLTEIEIDNKMQQCWIIVEWEKIWNYINVGDKILVLKTQSDKGKYMRAYELELNTIKSVF